MAKGVLLVVFLTITLAQFMPSCGGDRSNVVIGWVTDKYWHGRRQSYVVVINNVEHSVPDDFYWQVEVGDLVKNEGGLWTIVKKRAT